MAPTDVKCPTCNRGAGAPCIRLGLNPAGRAVWTTRDPHEARLERARD